MFDTESIWGGTGLRLRGRFKSSQHIPNFGRFTGGVISRIFEPNACTVCSPHSAKYGSTGYGCQSYSWSADQGTSFFPCLRPRLRIWSQETGSTVPSLVNPLILHNQAGFDAYSRASPLFFYYLILRRPTTPINSLHRHRPSYFIEGQFRAYRATQLRTDGVYRRESAGAKPVVLKVARVTGAVLPINIKETPWTVLCKQNPFSQTH